MAIKHIPFQHSGDIWFGIANSLNVFPTDTNLTGSFTDCHMYWVDQNFCFFLFFPVRWLEQHLVVFTSFETILLDCIVTAEMFSSVQFSQSVMSDSL